MLDTKIFTKELLTLLTREVRLTQTLLEYIQKERGLIDKHQPQSLEDSQKTKVELLDGLQQQTSLRMELMQEHGFSADPQGVQQCLHTCADNAALSENFKLLSELAEKCYEQNQLLGQLINRHALFFTFLLNNLGSTDNELATYQQNGSQQNPTGLRKLISV